MRKATDTAPKKLFQLEPPAEMVEDALDLLTTMDLAMFADHVETARTIWRKFPELVESPVFPEQLRAAYAKERGEEPSDDCGLGGEEALEPGYRENQTARAIEIAPRLECRATARPPAPRAPNTHDLLSCAAATVATVRAHSCSAPGHGGKATSRQSSSRKDLFSCQYLQTTKPTSCSLNTEHEVLSGLLTLLRDKSQWIPYFLCVLGRRSGDRSRPVTHKSVMEEVLAAYDDEPTNPESLEGVLMIKDPIGDSYHEIDDNEFKALSHYLKVIRAAGWLADRMSLEFDMFAGREQHYAPEKAVIQHLTDFAIEGLSGERR